jgi:PAS domain S-box-containing protein
MRRPPLFADLLLLLGGVSVLAGLILRCLPGAGWEAGTGASDLLIAAGFLGLIGTALRFRSLASDAQEAAKANRRLLEVACDAVVIVADDRRVIDISVGAAALFGYRPEELLGQSLNRLLPDWSPAPEDWPTAVRGRTGAEYTVQFPGRANDGQSLALEITMAEAPAPPRDALALLIRDVTRARRVRDELRATEAHVRLIVEQMPAILWTTDAQNRITSTVGAGLATLDLKPADVINLSMQAERREGGECAAEPPHSRVLRGESFSQQVEWQGRVFQLRVEPLRNPERRITGTIGVVLDVTDRKQAVAELNARVRQQAAIAALGRQALAGGDLDGLLDETARAVRQTLEVEFCEILELAPDGKTLRARAGSGWAAGLRDDVPAEAASPAGHALQSGGAVSVADMQIDPRFALDPLAGKHGVVSSMSVLVQGRGSPFGTLSAHATRHRPFTDDDRNFLNAAAHVLAAAVDRKEAEATHNRLEAQLRQAQKMEAVGRLAGGIAHDFNNLLCIISGYSEMALAQVPSDGPLYGFLSEIHKAGNRAATLTRQLLAFSRRSLLALKVLDVNALIRDAGAMLRRLIGEDIELVTTFDPSLPPVKTDPNQLEQVLMNLVVNARDAMPQGGRLEVSTTRVTPDAMIMRDADGGYADGDLPEAKPGSYVLLTVRDTGCGMDEPTQARIFEPFFTTKELGKGTGLGLAVVYGIVKQSGGYIDVQSALGQGTTFRIYLPAVVADRIDPVSLPPVGETPVGTETVLLAEDEEGVRALVLQVLRRSGYTVLEARDGEEALTLGKEHPGPIHLLLTDVVMPRLGGGRLASRLTRLRPETRVLFMSGFADSTLVRHEVVSGDVDCLLKPFSAEILARKVRETLDSAVVS